jgi:hypothetical protein
VSVPHLHELGEDQAVGFVEVVPGFAVGVVEAGEAAAFGAEQEAGLAEDVREWEDEPGIFGDDVGGDEIDFGELVGDGASVDAAVGVDVVEAVEQLGGGFDLDADEAGAGAIERQGAPLRSLWLRIGGDDGWEMGGVEDDVVAFAVAEGLGDAEAVAGGGEGKGEFGDFSAAFGGESSRANGVRSGGVRRWGAWARRSLRPREGPWRFDMRRSRV